MCRTTDVVQWPKCRSVTDPQHNKFRSRLQSFIILLKLNTVNQYAIDYLFGVRNFGFQLFYWHVEICEKLFSHYFSTSFWFPFVSVKFIILWLKVNSVIKTTSNFFFTSIFWHEWCHNFNALVQMVNFGTDCSLILVLKIKTIEKCK